MDEVTCRKLAEQADRFYTSRAFVIDDPTEAIEIAMTWVGVEELTAEEGARVIACMKSVQ